MNKTLLSLMLFATLIAVEKVQASPTIFLKPKTAAILSTGPMAYALYKKVRGSKKATATIKGLFSYFLASC